MLGAAGAGGAGAGDTNVAAVGASAVAAAGAAAGADASIGDGPVFTTEGATTAGLFGPAKVPTPPIFFSTDVGAATLEVAVAACTGGARLAPADGKSIVEVTALRRRLLLLSVFGVAQNTGDDCPCMLAPSAHSSRAELIRQAGDIAGTTGGCLLYTSPSPRDGLLSRMPSSA